MSIKKWGLLLAFSLILLVGCNAFNKNDVKVTDEMNDTISNYIVDRYKDVYSPSDKQFEVHKVYGAKESFGVITVYFYSLYGCYNKDSDAEKGGHSLPALVKLEKEDDGKYVVTRYKEPQDGDLYKDSIYDMFPRKYAAEALKDSGNVSDLDAQMQKKVEGWLTH